MHVRNPQGEKLDILLGGNPDAAHALVFVHGLGSGKHEGYHLFTDIAAAVADTHLTVQFDISGFGQSEGRQADFCLSKAAGDLQAVLDTVNTQFARPVTIIAHSFGGYVTSYANPQQVNAMIYTSMPNPEPASMVTALQQRILAKGSLDVNGISLYHRSSGEIQEIGAQFWRDMEAFDPMAALSALTHRRRLTVFSAQQDEIVKNANVDTYRQLGIPCHAIPGNHDYTQPKDRQNLLRLIKQVLGESVARPTSGGATTQPQ